MKRLILALLSCAALAAAPSCGKKDEAKGGDDKAATGGDKAGGDKAGGDKAAGGAQAKSAAEFFTHYNSLKGMELMDAYKDGVTVNGTVLRTITEMDESVKVWLDAGDGNYVSLAFTDKGAAAKEKAVKKDDEVKATCKVGGGMGKQIILLDCVMK